jgi:two-component system chemotaxis response regulator CheB
MSGSRQPGGAWSAFDVVIVAASLGGPRALAQLVAGLAPDLPAAVVVLQHRGVGQDGLAAMLARRSTLPAEPLREGAAPRAGVVTVCPPSPQPVFDAQGRLQFEASGARPSADGLLASAALAFGPRLLTVILTGRLADGARGVTAAKARGGRVLAQDHATSRSFEMPAAAIATGCVDLVLPLPTLAHAISTLVSVPGGAELFAVRPTPWASTASR